MRCARWRSRWSRAATGAIFSRWPTAGCSDAGDDDRAARGADPRSQGVRGFARLLPRELQRAALHRGDRRAGALRPGQPFALCARRAARPAPANAPARAGQAHPRLAGSHLRRRRRRRPGERDVPALGRDRARRRRASPGLDSGALRTRLSRPQRTRRPAIQDDRLLRARGRDRDPLGRPRARDRLAAARRPVRPFGQGPRGADARPGAAEPIGDAAMRVSVVGTGYVGLVTGACLAEMGNDVVCVDVDAGKVEALSAGQLTIYEPGLESLVAAGVRGERLAFTSDMDRAVGHAAVLFVAVGTPPDEDGSADLSHVLAVARSI